MFELCGFVLEHELKIDGCHGAGNNFKENYHSQASIYTEKQRELTLTNEVWRQQLNNQK